MSLSKTTKKIVKLGDKPAVLLDRDEQKMLDVKVGDEVSVIGTGNGIIIRKRVGATMQLALRKARK